MVNLPSVVSSSVHVYQRNTLYLAKWITCNVSNWNYNHNQHNMRHQYSAKYQTIKIHKIRVHYKKNIQILKQLYILLPIFSPFLTFQFLLYMFLCSSLSCWQPVESCLMVITVWICRLIMRGNSHSHSIQQTKHRT